MSTETATRPGPRILTHAGARFCARIWRELAPAGPGRPPRVLVAGCGEGHEAAFLQQRLDARVTAFDLDLEAPPEPPAGLPGLEFRRADVCDLPFDDESFDLVFYHHVIEHVDDPARSLAELARVLRPGGWLFVGTPNRHRLLSAFGAHRQRHWQQTWRNKLLENLADWKARLVGRFRNELGAHAGFSTAGLDRMLARHFADRRWLTAEYLRFKYGDGPLRLPIRVLTLRPLICLAAPSIYAMCRKAPGAGGLFSPTGADATPSADEKSAPARWSKPDNGAGALFAASPSGMDAPSARKAPRPLAPTPLRVMFVITCMPVGGAETLLVQLIRRMDRRRFAPELCCLKYFGPLGEVLAEEVPAFTGLLAHKYDLRVLGRLRHLMRRRRIDAVVTVGTGGDKMFWGRLAARLAGVPVICSALHSTGLPDRVEWLNRRLAPITDAFIAVARPHAGYLVEKEGCPADRVRVIPNGVDVENFHPRWPDRTLARKLSLPEGAPVVGIVAALRPEKNHELFLRSAARVRRQVPGARFLIAGDGPQRDALETLAHELSLSEAVHFLGTRSDVPEVLSLIDVLVLTSHAEANPVSILEAMAAEKPVVATRVGSVPETVLDGVTGCLAAPGDEAAIAERVVELLRDPERAAAMGRAGREHVIAHWSVQQMVEGYQDLIAGIYALKAGHVY